MKGASAGTFSEQVETHSMPAFDSTFIKPVLTRIKANQTQAIFVPHVEPLLLGLLKELAKVGLSHVPVFSIYSAQMKEVLEIYSPPIKLPGSVDLCNAFCASGKGLIGLCFMCGEYVVIPAGHTHRKLLRG